LEKVKGKAKGKGEGEIKRRWVSWQDGLCSDEDGRGVLSDEMMGVGMGGRDEVVDDYTANLV
jgi:hypothetical protein